MTSSKNHSDQDSDTLNDVCKATIKACKKWDSITTSLVGTGEVHIDTHNWSSFYKDFNSTIIKNLLSYNRFKVVTNGPGVIYKFGSRSVFDGNDTEFDEPFAEKIKLTELTSMSQRY